MPLIAHSKLPAFARLAREGVAVQGPEAWRGPRLEVGLVNTMADGALEATERQYLRLLAAAAPDRGIMLHVCGLSDVPRGAKARDHCARHYLDLAELRRRDLDALIVTGANIADPDLDRLPHRDTLDEVIAWAEAEVPTTLYSCLGTHAVLHFRHGKHRRPLAAKRWGVFPHRIAAPGHPLVAGLADGMMVPHSRWNEVPPGDFTDAGIAVLVVDAVDGAVHLAATLDCRTVFMQGHPEYEPVSLLKEHKREVGRFVGGERPDYPEVPFGIVDPEGAAVLADHGDRVHVALRDRRPPPAYPEDRLRPHLRELWRCDTERTIANWLEPTSAR